MVFVDQSALDAKNNLSLWALYEEGNPYRGIGGGVDAHPGDKGMEAIADSLYGAMAAYAVPEPHSAILLITGSIGVLAYAWKKRLAP
jgi:hypothetical protein